MKPLRSNHTRTCIEIFKPELSVRSAFCDFTLAMRGEAPRSLASIIAGCLSSTLDGSNRSLGLKFTVLR
jgi:hypothetical protein